MQRHIIHKQKVTLQVNRKEDAHGFQNLVSNLMQNELQSKIESVFNELFPSDKIIRIDSLQLDLGHIDALNFEQGFKSQFVTELTKCLYSKKENLSEANNEQELSNSKSLRNALIFFLEKGYLPWYRPAERITDLEEDILRNFSGNEYQYLFEWIRYHYKDNAVILQRLILQFSDVFLEKLLINIAPDLDDNWKNIYNDFTAILNTLLNQKGIFRTKIWKFTFHILLNNSEQGLSNKDGVWAFQILKLLVDRFAMSGSNITSVMEIKVKKKVKTKFVYEAFKDLLLFLETQDKLHPANKNKGVKSTSSAKKDTGKIDVGSDIIKNSKTLNTERYKNKDHISADEDAFYIKGGGVVILHFFLKPYFEDLKLLVKGKFADEAAHQRAVILLHYLATGEAEVAEFNLALQKILCGYPLNETLPSSIILTKKERAESEKLLIAVTDYWAPLKNTSVDGLRSAFLQREGKLTTKEGGWLLTVEQKTMDVLLGKIPWGFSTIRLPWMEKILNVDWY